MYPAVSWTNGGATYQDQDSDGLSDAYELAMGLNEQTANSDCDGSDDGVEFPIAGISPSDPMVGLSNCHDLRVGEQSTAGSLQLTLENFGPSIGAPARFKISLFSASTFTANVSVPSGCVSVAPPPHVGQMSTWSCAISGFTVGAIGLVSVNQMVQSPAAIITLKAEVEIGSGQSDPVLMNNLAQVSCSQCATN